MKRISYLLIIVTFAMASCKESWQKGEAGMQYKIVKSGSGAAIMPNDFIEIQATSIWNNGKKDSVLGSTYTSGGPQIAMFDSTQFPGAYYKIFRSMRKGDSLVTRILTDSIFKDGTQPMPPFMKKGQYVYRNFRVSNVYKTKEEAQKGQEAAMAKADSAAKIASAAQKKTDDDILTKYLKSKNINAQKTAGGTFVEIMQAGSGPMIDTSVIVKLKYIGTLLDGKVFDTNRDSSKGHTDPLNVNLTSNPMLGGGVIPGMTEGLKLLQKGSKARMYIPSGMAYGPQAAGPDIPANANLIFDLEVTEVLSKDQAKMQADAAQRKMADMQRAYADSLARNVQQQPK